MPKKNSYAEVKKSKTIPAESAKSLLKGEIAKKDDEAVEDFGLDYAFGHVEHPLEEGNIPEDIDDKEALEEPPAEPPFKKRKPLMKIK